MLADCLPRDVSFGGSGAVVDDGNTAAKSRGAATFAYERTLVVDWLLNRSASKRTINGLQMTSKQT